MTLLDHIPTIRVRQGAPDRLRARCRSSRPRPTPSAPRTATSASSRPWTRSAERATARPCTISRRRRSRRCSEALRADGYLGVGWTGQLDHGTVKALNELQEERGLYECGCVSYETIVALGLKPAVQVTTVAVGGTSGTAYGTDDPYLSGYRSGIYYPIAIPIFVPVDPDNPDGPATELPANERRNRRRRTRRRGPLPPGIRPLPPPTRVIPAGSRSGSVPIPDP